MAPVASVLDGRLVVLRENAGIRYSYEHLGTLDLDASSIHALPYSMQGMGDSARSPMLEAGDGQTYTGIMVLHPDHPGTRHHHLPAVIEDIEIKAKNKSAQADLAAAGIPLTTEDIGLATYILAAPAQMTSTKYTSDAFRQSSLAQIAEHHGDNCADFGVTRREANSASHAEDDEEIDGMRTFDGDYYGRRLLTKVKGLVTNQNLGIALKSRSRLGGYQRDGRVHVLNPFEEYPPNIIPKLTVHQLGDRPEMLLGALSLRLLETGDGAVPADYIDQALVYCGVLPA